MTHNTYLSPTQLLYGNHVNNSCPRIYFGTQCPAEHHVYSTRNGSSIFIKMSAYGTVAAVGSQRVSERMWARAEQRSRMINAYDREFDRLGRRRSRRCKITSANVRTPHVSANISRDNVPKPLNAPSAQPFLTFYRMYGQLGRGF